MRLPDAATTEVRNRLRRVAGQVQGVERMLEDGRDCQDIVSQIAAATKALEQAGFRLVAAGMAYCIENPQAAQAEGYDVGSVQKMFMRLA